MLTCGEQRYDCYSHVLHYVLHSNAIATGWRKAIYISVSSAVHDATHRSLFSGADSRVIYLDNIICQGDEQSLSHCSTVRNISGIEDCDSTEYAGVRCGGMCVCI